LRLLFLSPLWAYCDNNWWFLFGIAFAFTGSTIAQILIRKEVTYYFLLAYLLLIVFFGSGIRQYVLFFFACYLWNYLFMRTCIAINEGYENKYDYKLQEQTTVAEVKSIKDSGSPLGEQIKIWERQNPGKKITREIMYSLTPPSESKTDQ
jgi:hypothetical protein